MENKRWDIQGLRAIAIIGVVIFHIWPSIIPNGFLGVDIFFVISGFLMAYLWNKNGNHCKWSFINFYIKRIKRIVPLYLIVIATTFFIGYFTLYQSDLAYMRKHAMWSLMFLSNFKLFERKGYFVQQDEINFFLHTWSLAVEMQFYLIVPFILTVLNRVNRYFRIFLLFSVISINVYFYLNVPESVSFGPLHYRIWQFLVGMLAYFVGILYNENGSRNFILSEESIALIKSDEELRFSIKGRPKTYNILKSTLPILLTLIIIFQMCFIIPLNKTILRIMVTFIAGLLIFLGFKSQNLILTNRYSIYCGDISYALYLVHWPIMMFVRYYSTIAYFDHKGHVKDGLFIILTSINLSMFLHKYVDQRITKHNSKPYKLTFITLLIQMLLIVLIFISPKLPGQNSENDLAHYFMDSTRYSDGYVGFVDPQILGRDTYDRLIAKYPALPLLNRKRKCNTPTIKMPKNAKHGDYICEKRGNGSISVLVIGNSYAEAHFDGIEHALYDKYSVIRLYAHYGCPFFCEDKLSPDVCKQKAIPSMKSLIKLARPDILFIILRYDPLITPQVVDIKNDTCTNSINNLLNELSSYAKLIVLSDEQINLNYHIAYEMAKRYRKDMPLDNLQKLEITNDFEIASVRSRLGAIKCPKCMMLRWNSEICHEGLCKPYDEELKLPLYRDKSHINHLGVAKLYPKTKEAVEEAIKRINNF